MKQIVARLLGKSRTQYEEPVTYSRSHATQEFVMVSNGELIPIVREGDTYKLKETDANRIGNA